MIRHCGHGSIHGGFDAPPLCPTTREIREVRAPTSFRQWNENAEVMAHGVDLVKFGARQVAYAVNQAER
jgi:hypothetical protein